jgi:hypothetical protein
MDSEVDDILFRKFYKSYKKIIDRKLSKLICDLFLLDKVSYHKIYVITLRNENNVKDIVCDIIERHRNADEMCREYIANRNKMLVFNEVCKRILNEHYGVSPACRFGFDGTLCFDYKEIDMTINIYFKILE